MKKFVTIIMVVMVIMMVMMTSVMAEEIYYNDMRDYVYYNDIIEEFNEAFNKGISDDNVSSDARLYDGIVYLARSGLDLSRINFEGEFNKSQTIELEKYLEKLYTDMGIENVNVKIVFAGKYYDEEDLYYVTIVGTNNLNDLEEGHVRDGYNYFGMKVLATIYR